MHGVHADHMQAAPQPQPTEPYREQPPHARRARDGLCRRDRVGVDPRLHAADAHRDRHLDHAAADRRDAARHERDLSLAHRGAPAQEALGGGVEGEVGADDDAGAGGGADDAAVQRGDLAGGAVERQLLGCCFGCLGRCFGGVGWGGGAVRVCFGACGVMGPVDRAAKRAGAALTSHTQLQRSPLFKLLVCIRTFIVSSGWIVLWEAARAIAPATTSCAGLSGGGEGMLADASGALSAVAWGLVVVARGEGIDLSNCCLGHSTRSAQHQQRCKALQQQKSALSCCRSPLLAAAVIKQHEFPSIHSS